MLRWLAAAAVAAFMLATAADAQIKGLQPAGPPAVPAHAPDLSLPPEVQYDSSTPLQDGMITEEGVAPNALVGVGLAPMLGRKAQTLRVNEGPVSTRNPGVTFVVKF